MRAIQALIVLASAVVLANCGQSAETVSSKGPAQVDGARIMNADSEPGSWMTVGRTYNEQRFSPLKQINDTNAGQLGLAWSFDLDTARGQEATPLVVDGVMYFSTAWSKVKALDAKTGRAIWQYDPKVPLEYGVKVCCDVVNRGVAMWNGKIYVGTLDGRLIALDAANGQEVWSVQTTDTTKPYAITGAPRVAKGKVFIGNGGAEFGVRGYISAYDAETGDLGMALLHGAGPARRNRRRGIRQGDRRDRRSHLERRVLDDRRRRHGVGFDRLRSGARPPLFRRRQWIAVVAGLSRQDRRQSVPRLDRRRETGHRRICLALPGSAGRRVGLHRRCSR